jgi:hypothetical protein
VWFDAEIGHVRIGDLLTGGILGISEDGLHCQASGGGSAADECQHGFPAA